jgi:hypothetical protein
MIAKPNAPQWMNSDLWREDRQQTPMLAGRSPSGLERRLGDALAEEECKEGKILGSNACMSRCSVDAPKAEEE